MTSGLTTEASLDNNRKSWEDEEKDRTGSSRKTRWLLGGPRRTHRARHGSMDTDDPKRPEKWSFGVLNDKETDEVPGSILLLSSVSNRNEPLGLRNTPARTSVSSLPSPFPDEPRSQAMFSRRPSGISHVEEKKKTKNGRIILEPQPEESKNDPLNWPKWRRDAALLSLGFYCMIGGGMTPVLAAGFNDVATTYHVSIPQVALTTGLYMMGMGLGSVIASPTAILMGKRPVYIFAAILFLLTAVWCALSPNYTSLLVARIIQGMAVSPVECLPSATIAEIFFLHERAYRLGIYTLLLLGGKNLIPLVSAAIIQQLGWRWVFWIVAIVVGFCAFLLFFFVPETFWDRTPRPSKKRQSSFGTHLTRIISREKKDDRGINTDDLNESNGPVAPPSGTIAQRRRHKKLRVGFAPDEEAASYEEKPLPQPPITGRLESSPADGEHQRQDEPQSPALSSRYYSANRQTEPSQPTNHLNPLSPVDTSSTAPVEDYFIAPSRSYTNTQAHSTESPTTATTLTSLPSLQGYTTFYRGAPPKTYAQTLTLWSGLLSHDNWFRVAFRPFILFAYPAVLWSTVVYSLSVGWLIVLSESVSHIYRARETYNFTALQTGLVYLSPFIGGVLGTAVAGKVSDIIVRFMARKNGGIYEPEFRLVMALPVAVTTTMGLMGYGWSAEERDNWIVPTVFFGIISFGCSLGSTTAITFCVDSYRQYAGEALVTLNFSKNIFHGLVFSLFFNRWLDADGSKDVFIALGGIQLAFLLFTIPMYLFGKRARMWTVRRNLMEKF